MIVKHLQGHRFGKISASEETLSLLFIPKVTRSRSWFMRNKTDISTVEVRLEVGSGELEVKNFPFVTFSAEWSSGGASIEQEVTQGYGISLSFSCRFPPL